MTTSKQGQKLDGNALVCERVWPPCGRVVLLLTLSKPLFPSRLWPTRGWLAWFLLMGVGGPREALSRSGAAMAATQGGTESRRRHEAICHRQWTAGRAESSALLSPRSLTMMASDCRGTSLLFRGALVALGSRIIPVDTHTLLESFSVFPEDTATDWAAVGFEPSTLQSLGQTCLYKLNIKH